MIRFQENVCVIGPLDPVFDKNHESGSISDDFCDNFCANPGIVSYHVSRRAFITFYRVLNVKLIPPPRANMFSYKNYTNFQFTTFIYFCENVCANPVLVSYHVSEWPYIAFCHSFNAKLLPPPRTNMFSCKN